MPSLFKNLRRRVSQNAEQDQGLPPGTSSTLMHSPSMLSNTSKTSTIFSSSSHRHQYSIRVALLDGRIIQLNYTKNDDASHLFNRVCDEEQIGVEKDWFGLRFIDSHGQPHWLDMHKNARSQLKKGLPNSVHFRSFLKAGNSDSGMDAGKLKVSPSKSSMNSSYSSYASVTLPRPSKKSAAASPSDYDQQYRDTESFASESNTTFSFNNDQPSFSAVADNVSELQFRFKFYPQHPTQALQEESTRYALVKQLRSDFRQGKLTGSVSDESKFIACLLQADLGNLAEHQVKLSTSNIGVNDFEHSAPTPPMPSTNARTFASQEEAGGDGAFPSGGNFSASDGAGATPYVGGGHSMPMMTSLSPIPDIYREMNHFGNTGEEKILAEWLALADATPAECDETLLNVAAQLESYGIADMTPVHDQQTDRDGAMLGCNYAGILVRNATRRINAFGWQKVQKVSLDGKLILVYVLDSEGSSVGGGKNSTNNTALATGATNGGVANTPRSPVGSDETSKFVYKCRSGSGAKALWKFILENKIFYFAPSSKGIAPVRSGRIGPLSFHRRVTLRFSGRTSREAIEYGENIKRQRKQTAAVAASTGGGIGSASPPQPVQRMPLVATYALPDTLRPTVPSLPDHRAGTHAPSALAASIRHSAGSGADDEAQWSQNSKHDLINQLHDRQLKQSLEVMQAQTHNIADELQEIRSPNTVGCEASKRPKFDDFLPTTAVASDDGLFNGGGGNFSTNEGVRFCTVGDSSPLRDDMLAHSTPRRNVDDVLVLRDGQWLTPAEAERRYTGINEGDGRNADFSLRERVTTRPGETAANELSTRNTMQLNKVGSNKKLRLAAIGVLCGLIIGVMLWLLLSNNEKGGGGGSWNFWSSSRDDREKVENVSRENDDSSFSLQHLLENYKNLVGKRVRDLLENVGRRFD